MNPSSATAQRLESFFRPRWDPGALLPKTSPASRWHWRPPAGPRLLLHLPPATRSLSLLSAATLCPVRSQANLLPRGRGLKSVVPGPTAHPPWECVSEPDPQAQPRTAAGSSRGRPSVCLAALRANGRARVRPLSPLPVPGTCFPRTPPGFSSPGACLNLASAFPLRPAVSLQRGSQLVTTGVSSAQFCVRRELPGSARPGAVSVT